MISEEIIKKIWQRVRTKHLFPEIPAPKVAEGTEDVALEMKSKQITINTAFYDKIAHKMDTEQAVEALLDHGVTHYTYCPWDFHTHLRLFAEAKRVVKDKERAKRAAGLFMDVVADTHCVKKKKTPLPEFYKHIDEAEEKIERDRVLDITLNQPKQFQVVLYAIILISSNRKNIFTGEIYEIYKKICSEIKLRPLTQRRVSDMLAELDMMGIINAKIISKGRYGRTREITLSIAQSTLPKIKEVLDKSFGLK